VAFDRTQGPNLNDDRPERTPVRQAELPRAVAETLLAVRTELGGGRAAAAPVVADTLCVTRFSTYWARVARLGEQRRVVARYDVAIDYTGQRLRTSKVVA
jgi:hypothetical protein